MIRRTDPMIHKIILLLVSACVQVTIANAQPGSEHQLEMKRNIFRTFHKRAYTGQYPLRPIPVEPATSSKPTKKVDREPLTFDDRVWFPGEWEEVKAVILTLYYENKVPGHEGDATWAAEPVVEGHADYYHQNENSKWEIAGSGPYTTSIDTLTGMGKVFFHLIDGIQRGGAEAWVRLAEPDDTVLVYQTLQRMGLRHDRLRFLFGQGSSFWYRDCGPICFYYGNEDKLAMLDFHYNRYSRALDDQLPSLLHRQMGIPNYINDIVWEGGNCLVDGAGSLVASDAVYSINSGTEGRIEWDGEDFSTIHHKLKPALTPAETKQALQEMLGQRATHIVPRFLYDGGTGHVDLYADAWNENGFVFSGMPEQYSSWDDYITEEANIECLTQQQSLFGRNYYTMALLPFPSNPDGDFFKDQQEYSSQYSRTYANHTFVNNLILQPCFSEVGPDGMPTADWDRAHIEAIQQAYPGYTVYCIDVREFDGSGGAIHCITKQIPADNPVRILHKNIYGRVSLGNLDAVPFSAIITNKSGIAQAVLMYRMDGGEWQQLTLTSNGNRWWGSIPAAAFKDGTNVEYYFEATSVNGKTLTKPITASQGGYFSFTIANDATYSADMFDFDTQPMPMESITFSLGTNWLTEDTSKENTTGISTRSNFQSRAADGWYSLSGLRLDAQPARKGIYIYKRKKVVI